MYISVTFSTSGTAPARNNRTRGKVADAKIVFVLGLTITRSAVNLRAIATLLSMAPSRIPSCTSISITATTTPAHATTSLTRWCVS